jgi:Glu-tRNA(Gln) amidotransferase subunit E-like FAD-binding protein
MPRKKITPKQFNEVATGVRLSSHEKLCAERMNNILKSIEEMKREIKSLRQDVSMGKGGLKVIFYVGALVTAIIGFLKLLKFS